MDIELRAATAADAERCGQICHAAFADIGGRHGFPSDMPELEWAIADFMRWIAHPGYHVIVATDEARAIVGCMAIDERSTISGLGPIAVEPTLQSRSVGLKLLNAALNRSRRREVPGVRLVQAAFNGCTMGLCARAGFVVREPLVTLQGPALALAIPGYRVRIATESDLAAADALCRRIHGHERSGELRDAIATGSARIVEHDGRITGYASELGFGGHALGESNEALKALIGAAGEFTGQGFNLPTRNSELFRWCLEHGLRIVQPLTLMSLDLYNEPQGMFLPSITY